MTYGITLGYSYLYNFYVRTIYLEKRILLGVQYEVYIQYQPNIKAKLDITHFQYNILNHVQNKQQQVIIFYCPLIEISIVFFFSLFSLNISFLSFTIFLLLPSLLCIILLLSTSNLFKDSYVATFISSLSLQFLAICLNPLYPKHFLSCITFSLYSHFLLLYSSYLLHSLSTCLFSLTLIASTFLYFFSILLFSCSSFILIFLFSSSSFLLLS